MHGVGGRKCCTDVADALLEHGQVVALPGIRGGQGEEDEGRPLLAQIQGGPRVEAFAAQGVDPAGEDVDERDLVTHLDKATAGGCTDDSGTHNKNSGHWNYQSLDA